MTAEPAAAAPAVPVIVDLAVEDDRWLALAEPGALAARLDGLVARTVAAAVPDCGSGDAGNEVAVVLTDDEQVRRLNRLYRDVDRPTNVLSFALGDDPDAPPPPAGAPRLLGDVVIAYETVCAEAAAEDKPPLDHLSHLVVHGVLHLLGHDHDDAAPAARMEALETAILGAAGIADPYRRHAASSPSGAAARNPGPADG